MIAPPRPPADAPDLFGHARDRRGLIAGLGALALLPGCAVVSALGSARGPSAAYDLGPDRPMPRAPASLGEEIVIGLPAAAGALATDRILVRPDPRSVQYLADARWTEAAPQLMQTFLLRAFEETRGWAHVARSSYGGPPDHLLVGELVALGVTIAPDGAAQAEVALGVQLLSRGGARRLGARRFAETVPLADLEAPGVVAALNTAAGALAVALAGWAIATAQAGAAP